MQLANDVRALNEMVKAESAFVDALLAETGKVVVGQKVMIERLLMGLLCGGHVLLEGVPGLAKTLTVKTLADTIDARFQRIQFTPDLLPADLVGTMIYNQAAGSFTVRRGPIFANLVLADEINRAPAKVQSALLEAMQERQVTIGDTTHPLPSPFIVMATQNPIEQEGTYPLPEAQVDRFMLMVKVGYPTREEEREIMDRMSAGPAPSAQKVIGPQHLERARQFVEQVYVDPKVRDYVVNLVLATREPASAGLKELTDYIEYGASPRASIWLIKAARANAFLRHRGFVTPEDIKAVGFDVLRHRVSLSYEAEAEGLTPERIIQRIFDRVEVPWISRELIARIRRIEITTRKAVTEQLAGQYHSVFKGRGMAFSEVRLYQPGDEIRTIDWNVTARLQEPYVKVFTEERELTVMLLVDLSRSQDFGTIEKTKGETAAELASLLAFSAITNNDRVGAILFTDRVERFVPPKKGRKHVLALVSEILTTKPVGRGTDLAAALGYLARVATRRAVAFLMSDFLVPSAGPHEHALRVAARRHDLVPVAISDPLESSLPPLGLTLVEDPETGHTFHVDLKDRRVRERYAALVKKQDEARVRLFRKLDLDHVDVRCGDDYVRPLVAFFRARARRLAA